MLNQNSRISLSVRARSRSTFGAGIFQPGGRIGLKQIITNGPVQHCAQIGEHMISVRGCTAVDNRLQKVAHVSIR